MRWVLGGSLLAVVSVAAPQARAEDTETAVALKYEAWQIVAEAQLARVIAVDRAITIRDPAPAITEQVKTEKPAAEPAPVRIAAATAPVEGVVATVALAEPATAAPAATTQSATMPASVAAPAIVHAPLPRMRPLHAPPPPAVNSREDICNTLAESAQKHNLPLAFFGNLIYQESGLKPRVVSHVGARGIAQFMPGTAREVGLRNPFNPREALPASAKFLRGLLRKFDNNYGLAAAAYNAGPGKVSRWLKRRTVLPKETRDYVMTITGQRAENWRGIRGNKFGHRLARRMPCSNMVQFAHADEPTITEKGVVHAVYMAMPRPHPLRVAGQFASAIPMSISLTTSANAAPAPVAPATTPAVEPAAAAAPVRKDEERVSAPVPAPAMTTVATATESVAMPRVMPTSSEQTTGSVTTVTKVAPVQQPKPEKVASLQPAEKQESLTARFVAPLPRANPLREARLAEKHGEKHADKKSDKKSDKKAEAKKSAAKKRRG